MKKHRITAEASAKNTCLRKLHTPAIIRLLCIVAAAAIVAAALCSCGSSEESETPTAVPATEAATEAVTEAETVRTAGEEAQPDLLIGKWVSYNSGERFTAEYDGDGCLRYTTASGAESEYQYSVDGDKVILTKSDKRQVYLWTADAKTFMLDHAYGEPERLIHEASYVVEDLYGYIYVDGDYLYIGKLCMCRESALDSAADQPLEGSWTGAECDRVSFDAEGGYHYRQYAEDYDGTYVYDEAAGTLKLVLDDVSNICKSGEWGIEGRVLHIDNQYYFKDLN